MASRAVLVAAVLCIVLLATVVGIAGAADGVEEPINVSTTDETAVIKVGSCEGIGCWFSSEPYELYINGEHAQSLDYGDEYRVRDSDFTDNISRVAVTNTNFVTADEGWAYFVERNYPAEQSADGRDNERNESASDRGNGTTENGAPPEVEVELEDKQGFDGCMAEDRPKFHWPLTSEEEWEYCYEKVFS